MVDRTIRMISWNMAHKQESWRYLLDMKCDLALLQEACRPPDEIAEKVKVDPVPWPASERDSRVKWRSAIAVLSNRIDVEWLNAEPIGRATYGHHRGFVARHADGSTGSPALRRVLRGHVDVCGTGEPPQGGGALDLF